MWRKFLLGIKIESPEAETTGDQVESTEVNVIPSAEDYPHR